MHTRGNGARPVVSFGKLKTIMPMPNMLDVQLRSFEKLVEVVADPVERWDFGLDRVFGEIFPISDVNENFTLEYVSNALGEPKYSVEEWHRARHDLRCAPQGDAAADRLGGA